MRGWWRWGHRCLDGVASRRIVGAFASVIFPCTVKFRRWRALMEEVDKGCSEFCATVGTVTRTVSILIHSRLKALALNFWAGHPVNFWLFAGLIRSNNPHCLKEPYRGRAAMQWTLFSMQIFLLLHGCESVKVYTVWCQRHVCEQLAKVVTWKWNGRESNPQPLELQVQHPNHYTNRPHFIVTSAGTEYNQSYLGLVFCW